MTTTTWLALLAVGIPGVVSLVVAMRNTSTTKQVADRSASLEEFDRLRLALRGELNEAMARIEKLEAAVESERTKREAAESRAQEAEERADRAERKVDVLQRRVDHLEQVLRRHQIDPDGGS